MELVQSMTGEDTQRLLSAAKSGDLRARELLLTRYRSRLRQMIRCYLDPRLSARIDPSDVLQNALTLAVVRLPEYFDKPTISFYGWLRQITREELIQVHRQHVLAQRRAIGREVRLDDFVTDESAMQLATQLVSSESSPSQVANMKELHAKVKQSLAELPDSDREILLMRCAEHLKISEIAQIMTITETAAKSRLRRALQKLCRLLGPAP